METRGVGPGGSFAPAVRRIGHPLLTLGGHRPLQLEGLGAGGESQVAGEPPLAISCVPSLAGSIARASGAGCVHLLFSPLDRNPPAGDDARRLCERIMWRAGWLSSSTHSVRPGPVRVGRSDSPTGGVLSTIHIALCRRNRTRILRNSGNPRPAAERLATTRPGGAWRMAGAAVRLALRRRASARRGYRPERHRRGHPRKG